VSALVLESWFLSRLPEAVRDWYARALTSARRDGVQSDSFLIPWSGCGRRLGRVPITIETPEVERLRNGGAFVPAGWGMDEIGRAVLLLATVEGRPPERTAAAIDELYRKGELREQQAVLRVLAYLPDPTRYVALASEAVRNNVVSVLESLACDNTFPAAHMSELAFNQMVMKAIFNGLPLARVRGLDRRNGAELRRMVAGFASERRAAGRPVPGDLNLILGGS
jgi:hypothetical protein